jgi:predicted O-methyltransferase YrrM
VLPSPASPDRYVREVVRDIEGWLSEAEGRYLYALAARGPGTGLVVEIGSSRGKSTLILATASRAAGRGPVVAIDPHLHHGSEGIFRANVARAGLADHVRTLVLRSDEAVVGWQEPIRFLWIDGSHEYGAVRRDYEEWERFVVPGGIIAFHDTFSWDGPRRLVEDVLVPSGRLATIGIVDSITAFRKVPALTTALRLRNTGFRALRRLHALGRRRRLPGEVRHLVKAVLRAASATR